MTPRDYSEEYARVLDRAAERVEMGWCQHGVYVDTDGRMCAMEHACRRCAHGALLEAAHALTGGGRASLKPLSLLADLVAPGRAVVGGLRDRDVAAVTRWNDAPGRTQAEVAAALRETARRVRAGELTLEGCER